MKKKLKETLIELGKCFIGSIILAVLFILGCEAIERTHAMLCDGCSWEYCRNSTQYKSDKKASRHSIPPPPPPKYFK